MEEKKLTDEEIIKAFENCITQDGCENCPYDTRDPDCGYVMTKPILDLIHRQKAEIEELKKTKFGNWKVKFFKAQEEIERLTEENERLSDLEFTQEHCDLYKENEYLKSCLVLAKKQAVKDTAKEILSMFDDRNYITENELKKAIAERYGLEVE